MKILSHRGYWNSNIEKNSITSFDRSFQLGFGTETDIRDHNGELVISHDIATKSSVLFDEFLERIDKCPGKEAITIALNIKADGLSELIKEKINKVNKLDLFVFDMSIPDMRTYLECKIPVFTRMSEVEQNPVWIDQSQGVWLDSFESDWYDIEIVEKILRMGKRVCIVSPELHKRNYMELWLRLKKISNEKLLMLCTDYPERAKEYFEIKG